MADADVQDEKKSDEPAADAGTDDELEQDAFQNDEGAPSEPKISKKEQERLDKKRRKDTETISAGGDFQVQVHIIEGRELIGLDSGGSSDPVVTVTILGEKKSTAIKSRTKNPRWDQVLYFELSGLEPDELSRGKALIEVFDADMITKNDLIGAFEFDLAWIYYREHHEVYNQWVGLTNTDADEEDEDADDDEKEKEGIDGIDGYLKLSVTILGANDEQYIHDEEEELAKEDKLDSGMILVSPGIEQTPHLLTLRIYEARALCKTDVDSIISKMRKNTGAKNLDPFFYVEYAGCRLRSKVYKGVNCDPQVEFQIPIMEPVFTENITINIMDWDQMSRNDRIASLKLNYMTLKKDFGMRISPRWVYAYGAPRGYQSGYARKMNKGLVEGSNFRGMLFAEAFVECIPKRGRKKVREQINALQDHERPRMVEYYLRCDLYEGTEINKIKGVDHKMFVQVAVNEHVARSSAKKISEKNSSCKWYEVLKEDGNEDKCIGPFLLPEGWEKDPNPVILPDVFIYLCVKETLGNKIEQVSYCRVPLSQIIPASTGKGKPGKFKPGKKRMWENAPKWYDMKENLALDKYSDNVFPGALLIGLNCGPKSDISKADNDGRLASPPPISRPFSNSEIFKALPTDKTPEPPSPDQVMGVDDEMKSPVSKASVGSAGSAEHRPTGTHANVTISCLEAVSLPALDRGNQSDPYVEIVIEDHDNRKREKETEPIKKNLNPKWNQDLEFDRCQVGDMMFLRVMDWDFGLDKDDEMGYIDPMTLTGTDFEGWLKLKPSKEVQKKYKKKPYLLDAMKIKIKIKYQWDDVGLDEDARQKKKGNALSFLSNLAPKKEKKPGVEIEKLHEPKRQPMQLRVHCFQARNLENADVSGLSDAYLVVRFCGRSDKTRVIEDHIDPKWYQSLYLPVNVPVPLQYAPRIYAEVFDKDNLSKDQSLGRFSVIPENVWKVFTDENDNKVNDADEVDGPQPRWFKLEDAEHRTVSGEVLCAFELVGVKQSNFKKPNINPPCAMVKKWASIVTLGLRDIQSTFGCNKPYIEFEANGTCYATEKSNRPSARNPNFCQILKLEVDLPEKRIFLPNLNLTIKDSLFGGLITRKLGFASIEVEDLIDADAAEQFKLTDAQKEEQEIRQRAKEKMGRVEEENVEVEEQKHEEFGLSGAAANAADITFTSQSEDVDQPLLNKSSDPKNTAAAKEAQHNAVVLEMKKQAVANGHFEAYEYSKKSTYDLSKTQPDYMKDRDSFDDELEDQMPLKPFLQIPFFAGKSPPRTVGYFKGLISFADSKKDDPARSAVLKEIRTPTPLYLRLYVLTGTKLVPRDSGGASDPYLVVRVGKEKRTTRNDYIANTLEPGFYHSFEIPLVLPGPSRLEIEVWDWDGIGDDLIGKTVIDIEDRWYSEAWRNLQKKPVETRSLWSPQSTVSQGKVRLWMELVPPADAKKYPLIDIAPPPQMPFELRVVVWECKDCPIMDETTSMNDLYITGELISSVAEEEQRQQTDLHFRSQNGCGSFNWRMKFPVALPKRSLSEYPSLNVQIWDKDFFSPSDNISEAVIPLQPFLRYCEKYSTEKRCMLTLNEEDEFWIDLKAKGGGKIKLSIELLPERIAKQLPAGFGRDAPNANPHLPEPEGRAQFSLFHPCDSLRNLLGDKLCCKIVLAFCCLVLIALLIFITPNLISAIAANLVTG